MSFDQWNQQPDAVNLSQWLAQQQGPKQAAPTKKKGRGGPLTSLISEAGGTGGALGGAAIGTAILPGIGTILGAGIGGAIGGFGGRIAENEVRDGRAGIGDAAQEGVISGITGAGPLKLLKVGKVLATGAKAAAPTLETAIVDAGAKAATGAPLKTSLAGKTTNLGNKLLSTQWGTLDKPTIRATNAPETVAKLADIGIINPNDAERIASGLTGSSGLLNQAVVQAIGGAGKVPTHNVGNVMEQAIQENGLVDKEANSVRQVVAAQLGKLGDGNEAEPTKVLNVMKSIEKRVADLGGRGGNHRMATPERMDQAKALMSVHDELQNSLYQAAGADKNVSGVLTPELRDKLISLHPDSKEWASHVDKTIMKSKTVGDLRTSQAPFVNAQQMIDNAASNSFSFGGKAGNAIDAGGSLGGIAAKLATNVVKDPAARVAGTALRAVGGAGGPGALSTGAKGIVTRQAAGDVGKSLFAPAPANAQSLEEALMQQNGGQDPSMGQNALDPSMQEPQAQQMPYSKENLVADIQRDPKNASKYLDYYTQLDAIFNPAVKDPGAGYSKPSAQQYAQGITGSNSIDQLEQLVGQDPGIVNRAATPGQNIPIVGSLISRGTNSTAYRGAGNNILNSIARINTGANMPESERKFYEQTYLPQPGDPPQAIQQKLATLRQFFAPITNYQSSPSGNLSDALMQAQGAYQ